jgi:hypothetical protein
MMPESYLRQSYSINTQYSMRLFLCFSTSGSFINLCSQLAIPVACRHFLTADRMTVTDYGSRYFMCNGQT